MNLSPELAATVIGAFAAAIFGAVRIGAKLQARKANSKRPAALPEARAEENSRPGVGSRFGSGAHPAALDPDDWGAIADWARNQKQMAEDSKPATRGQLDGVASSVRRISDDVTQLKKDGADTKASVGAVQRKLDRHIRETNGHGHG